ncbi:CPBP family intramembrane glutamic endopeptidase [Pseudodonghicola xiamenensis]|uniref:CAAX prenyl protease 2/Lysostaphin resistance protein A-like domain-containing protein n=1 Tax=Pseudodonghicola xiamenensis TaxID=337702 RepID=A0A8J3H4K2_9RHOB|nr:CPBP family intramembrane glutamic endopeptidase [Pseudodonghicola xiamenensis]GHG81799.1 hypothetical protein GCM10010961_05820 [Pseudodonghicola xiamenensis]
MTEYRSFAAYAEHALLVEPIRSRRELWRLLLGGVLILVIIFGLNSLFYNLVRTLAPAAWYADLFTGHLPGPTLLMLASFGFMTLATLVAANLLQKRPGLSVLGPPARLIWQFWRVLRLLLVLGAVMLLLPPYDVGEPLVPNLSFGHWLMLLPLSLGAVLIQTSAEEVLFRGYLQQSLAARFSSPLVWMVIPSALFALGHYMPVEAGPNAGLVVVWAALFGVLMADLTARAGSLGPAIAVHFFNNITALLFTASPEVLNGLSLYLLPFPMSGTELARDWLAADFAMLFICWLVARLAIRR